MLVFNMIILVPTLKILTFSHTYYFMNIFGVVGSCLLFVMTFYLANNIIGNDHYRLFEQ